MSTSAPAPAADARHARSATAALRAFNLAGVLAPADVHVARRLAELAGERDDAVVLAVALATRAPRLGHVFTDLTRVRGTVSAEGEEGVNPRDLAWPDSGDWVTRVARSALVAVGEDAGEERPLRLVGTRLYLDRYWREERAVAADLRRRAAADADGVDEDVLAQGLARLFHDAPPDLQRLAAAVAVRRRLAVLAGGPGTGKTTTVARILALLGEQAAAAGEPPPLVALAAPTGKAAARLGEAVAAQAATLPVAPAVRADLSAARATTLHRLLGWRPGNHSRFRHHRGNRLPHDVVVVDETSMISLTLMARLVEAVRPGARLILVGDPRQLSSVEAGAVLGDIVGPAAEAPRMRAATRRALERITGHPVPGEPPAEDHPFGDGVVTLTRIHRFGGAIAELAEAVRRGDADAALEVLGRGTPEVTWLARDPLEAEATDLAPVRRATGEAGARVVAAARAGDPAAALAALGAVRVLCAHRRGPHGVQTWNPRVEGWLAADLADLDITPAWYVGRPLLVTANDPGLGLNNGDTGVVIAGAAGRPVAAFARGDGTVTVGPTRLGPAETVYAMTIHKAQGSQFDRVTVVLPGPESPILTRELLYTGITRARDALIVIGAEESVRAAVARPIARASGLRERVWGPGPTEDRAGS